MKSFGLKIVVILLICFAVNQEAFAESGWKMEGGPDLVLNKVVYKQGAKMPPSSAVQINTIQRIWNRLSQTTGFSAFVAYDDSDEVNAYIQQLDSDVFLVVIQLGLLKVLRTEDEAAGVLAHEIGHGVNRHGEKTRNNTVGMVLGANILSAVLGGGALVDTAIGVGTNLAVNGYSREQEVAADDYGTEYSAKAGFSPWGLYNSITRMADAGLVTPPSGFNSHPPTERRMTRLRQQAEIWEDSLNKTKKDEKSPVNGNASQPAKLENQESGMLNNSSDGADVIASFPLDSGDKNVLTILHNRSVSLYNSGRYKDALAGFVKAAESYDGNYLHALWAARSAQKLGKKGEAKKWVDKALEINPNYEPAKRLKSKL